MSRIRWRRGTVTALGRTWRDSLELQVEVPGDGELRALAHPSVVGTPEVGDAVLLNTTAWAQRLGTGGYALVVAVPDRLPPDPTGPGHLVKGRYTGLQVTVQGVDEQETPHHAVIAEAEDVGGMPVVVADLHSALPAVLAGVHATDPGLRVAYVMTDGGALPAAFSRTLDGLAGSLAGVVTVGQAFGGDLEAVTGAHRAAGRPARAARRRGGRRAGPGEPGHGDAVGLLRGGRRRGLQRRARAGRAHRRGAADLRRRPPAAAPGGLPPLPHGVRRVALGGVALPVPASGLSDELEVQVAEDLAGQPDRNPVVEVEVEGLDDALRALPVGLSTMGRGLDADHAYFLAAACAGRYAASLVTSS